MEADYHVGLLLEQSRNYEILLKNMESLLFQPGNHSEFKLNDKSSRAIIDTVAAHLAAHASEKISLQAVAEEFGEKQCAVVIPFNGSGTQSAQLTLHLEFFQCVF